MFCDGIAVIKTVNSALRFSYGWTVTELPLVLYTIYRKCLRLYMEDLAIILQFLELCLVVVVLVPYTVLDTYGILYRELEVVL